MSYEEMFEKLGENPIESAKEAVRLLIKIVENILKNPKDLKFRTLQKNNPTLSKKLLPVAGVQMCLELVGFQESNEYFTLPLSIPLSKLEEGKDALCVWKEAFQVDNGKTNERQKMASTPSVQNKVENSLEKITPFVLPPLVRLYANPFLHQVEVIFHEALRFEDKNTQIRARNLIPLQKLEKLAQERLRTIQEYAKKNHLGDPNISIQETLLLELLAWFKEDFFSWVDSPDCEQCGGKSAFSHMSTDPKLLVYTNRVELHRCQSCHTFTPFPRYTDMNILLETRRGRCGEWANTFTLLCRSLGWDARFVMDETDHVWTEVYSIAQQRWLHCDPCENICDQPLMYETGWKKTVSYVMAYSGEEVQDVTWRYTCHHKEVLKRRTKCTENELVDVLLKLREKRQMVFSESRKNYLRRRLLMELVELMNEKKPGECDNKGRVSGSEAWRLQRGEIQTSEPSRFIWKIDTKNVKERVCVRYSAVRDKYEYIVDNDVRKTVDNWNAAAVDHSNVFRKVEKDWKKVYITRTEGCSEEGRICWRFDVEGDFKILDTVIVDFSSETFENGRVCTQIFAADLQFEIPNGQRHFSSDEFNGKKSITIQSTLSGGKGDMAWQHAQLFRESLTSDDFPFSVTFIFK
ncbi:peptide-N(4)-(N-acetyl-beta-glucosaminyl)asparagine amidase [Cylas formicarius]|uniref:peptide-N(4)-(N-acetyl-beta- glucosaminyl)asparagine amidase n=1 Tax=Cylas formicarius TaxID=197179 RepID=UPI0029583F0F|nr:peptide-N(4)-(N-acetyl-beta-glucosaminyl)asparagine amidase [Cylas formicarius]